MPSRAKVSVYEGMGEQKPLRLITRFEPLHVALAPPCRTMRVLGPIVEIAALTVFDVRKKLSSSHAVAPQFVGHDHSRLVLKPDEQPSEETLRGFAIATALNQDIEHDTVLVHRAPEVMKNAVDPNEHFIEIPFITRPWPATPDPFREARAEFRAPAAHGFVRQGDPSLGQQQFDVAEAQTERVIQPHGVTDDLRGEPVAVVRVGFELHPRTLTRGPAQRNAGLSVNLTMPGRKAELRRLDLRRYLHEDLGKI